MRFKYFLLVLGVALSVGCGHTPPPPVEPPVSANSYAFEVASAYVELSYITKDKIRVQDFMFGKHDPVLRQWYDYWGKDVSDAVLHRFVQSEYAGQ